MTKLSAGLAVAVVLATSSALAVAFRHRPETVTFTPPAGSAGEGYVDILTTADYYGLQVITLWDYDGRVCAAQLEQRGFATGTKSVMERVKVCEPRVAETWRRADVGDGHFITGVSACVGGSEGTVRGLEVWGSLISDKGVAGPPVTSARFAFEDCAWTEIEVCPRGLIATGVRLYSDDAQNGVVGVALRCHRLAPR